MSIHSLPAVISGGSAASYLAYSLRGKNTSADEVGLKVLTALGIGMASYAISYVGLQTGLWGYRLVSLINSDHRQQLFNSILHLDMAHLSSGDNIDALLVSDGAHAQAMTQGLVNLQRDGILTEANRNSLKRRPEMAIQLSIVLCSLHRGNLLNEATRNAVEGKSRQYNGALGGVLVPLTQRNLLDEQSFQTLLTLDDHFLNYLRDTFFELERLGVQSNENCLAAIQNRSLSRLSELMEKIPFSFPNPEEARAFVINILRIMLSEDETYTQNTLHTMQALEESNLLTQDNVAKLITDDRKWYAREIDQAISNLQAQGTLNQMTLNTVFATYSINGQKNI